jgi:opacity protein-like surface antigen
MSTARAALLSALILVLFAAPAAADATLFLGANTTPESRKTQGFSIGAGLLLIGFEFEYAGTSDDLASLAPTLKTYSGNVLLQTPFTIFGIQPYFTTGAGAYREALDTREHTGFGFNTGGGVKVSLIGPLRLRVDYRAFRLGDDALYSPAHRLYLGLNLKF